MTITSLKSKLVRIKHGRGDRSPDFVIDQRIAEAAAVIALKPSIHRCELHRLFSPRWVNKAGEPCHWKTVDRIVGRARSLLIERSERSKDDWIRDLMAGYDKDMGDADAKTRMAAREGIRKLLGLDAPSQHRLGNPDGSPMAIAPVVNFIIPDNGRDIARDQADKITTGGNCGGKTN